MDRESSSRRALKSAQEQEASDGAETKETEPDMLQRQWNKGVKGREKGGRGIARGMLLKQLVQHLHLKSTCEHERMTLKERETRLQQISYSGKFLRGRNLLDFQDQTPACENLFPQKFLLPTLIADELRKLSTVCLSCRSSKLTENLSQNHRANCRNFSRPTINLPVITTIANRSSELAPSLWHGSFSQTATDMLW